MNLKRLDGLLKTLAAACAALAGSTYAGFIPGTAAIILGLAAALLAAFAGSPLFDPTLAGKTPVLSRILLSVAVMCGAASGSTFFPAVQHLFSDGVAHKLATGVALAGALCTLFAQSPVIAGGTIGAGGSAALVLLLGLSLLGVSSCAHVNAITKDVESCVTADGPQALKDLERDAIPALTDAFMCDASTAFDPHAVPMCLVDAFEKECANLGPDAERFKLCVITTVENDPLANPIARTRAKATRARLVRQAGKL